MQSSRDYSIDIKPGWSAEGPLNDAFKNATTKLSGSSLAIIVAIVSVLLVIVAIGYIVATWRGRKWALWLTFLIQLPGVGFAVWTIATLRIPPDPFSVVGFLVFVYAALRILGVAGPKL